MQSDTNVFFVSNIHVMSGGENFSIKNVYGETIQVPAQVEVAADRDLVRFPVDYPRGLGLADDFEFEDKVCAVGNSGGGGVVTRIDGTILALGPGLVEVSCPFIPGNSGEPVVNESNEVVGVSTYLQRHSGMPEWIIKGSRFEGTRRMSVRVDQVDWVSMSWDELNRQSGYVNEVGDYSSEIIGIVDAVSTNAYEMVFSELKHSGLQTWITKHNQNARKAGRSLKKVVDGNRIRYEISSTMERSLRKEFSGLSSLMKKFNNMAQRDDQVTLPYFKERLEGYARYFEASEARMETVANTLF